MKYILRDIEVAVWEIEEATIALHADHDAFCMIEPDQYRSVFMPHEVLNSYPYNDPFFAKYNLRSSDVKKMKEILKDKPAPTHYKEDLYEWEIPEKQISNELDIDRFGF